MDIVSTGAAEFPALWNELWRQDVWQYPLYTPLSASYSRAYHHTSEFDDRSFLISDNGDPVLGLRLSARYDDRQCSQFSAFAYPIAYLENLDLGLRRRKSAFRLLRREYESLRAELTPENIWYRDFLSGGRLSRFGYYLLSEGDAVVQPFFTQLLDLSQTSREIYKHIRKSYKHLINWGNKNLSITIIGVDTVTSDDMDAFRALHTASAGRATRPAETWRIQCEMVKRGEAFIVKAETGGQLVSAALFNVSDRYCFYSVSASDREMFDKPLSHSILWRAVTHAKEVGCRWFEVGQQLFPQPGVPTPSEKELSISTFKHGFGGETVIRLDIGRQLADVC